MPKQIDLGDLQPSLARDLVRILAFAEAQYEFRDLTDSLARRVEQTRQDSSPTSRLEPQAILHSREWLATLDAGEGAGRLHEPALFTLRVMAIERVYDARHTDGVYEIEYRDVNEKIEAVRALHGRDPDEYWPVGEGPEEYAQLSAEYDSISARLFHSALQEFGLDLAAELFERDRAAYNKRRELGRKALLEGLSDDERLHIAQEQFEYDAYASARLGAYHAATTMLGAAMETLLLRQCLLQESDALVARDRLPESARPKSRDPRKWRLVDLAKVAREAAWLPDFSAPGALVPCGDLVDLVRDLRNLVHPAKHLTDGLPSTVARSTHRVAEASYRLLKAHLECDSSRLNIAR